MIAGPWKLEKILVATDFSESADSALKQAMWLAERTSAELTVAHVLSDVRTALCDMPPSCRWELVGGDIDKFEHELRRKADEQLATSTSLYRGTPVRVHCETLLGKPFVEIIHAAQKEGYDLVLAGTRGLSGLKRVLVGSTAERLVRNCPCPVWIVKHGHEGPLQSILAAVDFSDVSGKALKIAAQLATYAGCQLNVLHVMFTPVGNPLEAISMTSERPIGTRTRSYWQTMRRACIQRLSELAKANVPEDQRVQLRVTRGEPWKAISATARRCSAELIVMGSVGRSAIPGLLMGNTAEKVLRTCDRSILTVKPDSFVCPIQRPAWSLHPAEPAPSPSGESFEWSRAKEDEVEIMAR